MENAEKKGKVNKIISIILNVLFYLFIAFLLLFAIANIRAKNKDGNNIPNIFGYGFLGVSSDSMKGNNEDSFDAGDLIIVKIANKENIANIKVGDIVTFYDTFLNTDIKLNTHRVVEVQKNDLDGKVYYILQGDKAVSQNHVWVTGGENASLRGADGEYDHNYVQFCSEDDIKAIYSSKSKGLGKLFAFITDKVGFAVCIVLPTFILLAVEIGILLKNILKLKGEKQREQNKEDLEAEREKMKAELLKELLKEQEQAKNNQKQE